MIATAVAVYLALCTMIFAVVSIQAKGWHGRSLVMFFAFFGFACFLAVLSMGGDLR